MESSAERGERVHELAEYVDGEYEGGEAAGGCGVCEEDGDEWEDEGDGVCL